MPDSDGYAESMPPAVTLEERVAALPEELGMTARIQRSDGTQSSSGKRVAHWRHAPQ